MFIDDFDAMSIEDVTSLNAFEAIKTISKAQTFSDLTESPIWEVEEIDTNTLGEQY